MTNNEMTPMDSACESPYNIVYSNSNDSIDATITINDKEVNVTYKLEIVTPTKAREYLNILDETRQRSLRKNNVRSLSLALERGRGCLTGDAIILVDGKLIQGQHRCWAIIESNVALPLVVMTSTDETLYDTIDGGLPRAFSDRIPKEIPHGKSIGAAINFVGRYDQGENGMYGLTLVGGDNLHCKSDSVAYFYKHSQSLQEAVLIAIEDKNFHFPTSVGTAFLELSWRKPEDKMDSILFLNKIISGVGLASESSVHILREWLERKPTLGSRYIRPELILGQLVAAWNAQQMNTEYSTPRKMRRDKKLSKEDKKFPRFYWEKKILPENNG